MCYGRIGTEDGPIKAPSQYVLVQMYEVSVGVRTFLSGEFCRPQDSIRVPNGLVRKVRLATQIPPLLLGL